MSRLPSTRQGDFGGATSSAQRISGTTYPHRNLSEVLKDFDNWGSSLSDRSRSSEFDAGVIDFPTADIAAHEAATARRMKEWHDSLHESDRLVIYRFFLTAVHRNAAIMGRFMPSTISSPERQAAMWAEYDGVSSELDELIKTVAGVGVPIPGVPAQLLAADFLWSMAWWVHARRDVMSFVPLADRSAELATVVVLGREPDPRDHVGAGIYEYAALSEKAYRTCRQNGYAAAEEQKKKDAKQGSLSQRILQAGNHL